MDPKPPLPPHAAPAHAPPPIPGPEEQAANALLGAPASRDLTPSPGGGVAPARPPLGGADAAPGDEEEGLNFPPSGSRSNGPPKASRKRKAGGKEPTSETGEREGVGSAGLPASGGGSMAVGSGGGWRGHRKGGGEVSAGMVSLGQRLVEAWERHEEHLMDRQMFFEYALMPTCLDITHPGPPNFLHLEKNAKQPLSCALN